MIVTQPTFVSDPELLNKTEDPSNKTHNGAYKMWLLRDLPNVHVRKFFYSSNNKK